ncbi:hypothetical protein OE88DRAFT_1654341 [Heliocybe sulcata]|uniref:Uncharacterized protein n=1 Tax=Heliocybe sulcata TaxID=5364 RepID=A0A5C3N9C3_9AGAM|nr:hypothetical protein OE88DRAFT_1654341 [Heliocybe sulcata]
MQITTAAVVARSAPASSLVTSWCAHSGVPTPTTESTDRYSAISDASSQTGFCLSKPERILFRLQINRTDFLLITAGALWSSRWRNKAMELKKSLRRLRR